MMTKMLVAMGALATLGMATLAHADMAAANACAANLKPDGKQIYAAVIAAKPTSDTLQSTMESQTRGLAMNGKIGRGEARDNAIAARDCVRLSF
ncbi:MAG: hypothetical protein AB7F22_29975 [Reyranella sp.]|uniref:hypothetical protein n=1 Tax=Reyranella sp. TaxID=1929291 RepID=UPI003D1504A9